MEIGAENLNTLREMQHNTHPICIYRSMALLVASRHIITRICIEFI